MQPTRESARQDEAPEDPVAAARVALARVLARKPYGAGALDEEVEQEWARMGRDRAQLPGALGTLVHERQVVRAPGGWRLSSSAPRRSLGGWLPRRRA